ncbi:YidC/Oxa1 family membrane protein insertase [Parafrigoribacterium soli]|uniref:YidC/Oxa1 family membrane protein insertase n=1 Tax=Parafrigoribacterium soli TaxID=3144663 RepID=UPI0032EED6E7
MDLFALPPVAAVFDAAYALVQGLATLFNPIAGTASAAVAIVALTMIVRAALIPVGASQVKAEWVRRRLAPRLQALQRKYKKNPQLLQEKTLALYRAEKTSPFAGMLPTLAQAPVLSLVYALFLRGTVDGHDNALLGEHLFGVPLGTSFAHLVSGSVGGSGVLLYAALFAIMATTAWFSRRTAQRLARPVQPTDAAAPLAGLAGILSWLPFMTVVFAAFVPLAAALYLVTTTAWTLLERAVLRRRYWREPAVEA